MKKQEKNEEKKEEVVLQDGGKKRRPILSKLIILVLLVAMVYIYARYVGIKGLVVREYNIVNESIPESFDGFSIVQFSDLEFFTTFTLEDLDKMVEKINEQKTDVVVFTGDLAKASYSISDENKKKLIEKLSSIDPLIGKYSIRGDDDFEGSLYDEVMVGSGFKDITNSYELIYYKGLTPIVLYGLGSKLNGSQDFTNTFSYPKEDEDTTFMATYRILLAHEPDTISDIQDYNISLMLSGHSHNSELNIPYLKTLYHIKGATTYYDPEYKVGGTELYISSGLGTSKHMVRLFSKPSISVFRLYTD